MINIEQFTEFLNEQEISSEEAFLLMAINYRQQNSVFALSFSRYYERNQKRFKYRILIDKMIERGFLKTLNVAGEYKLDRLQITDKFRSTLMVEVDDAFKEAKKYYPKTIQFIDQGVPKPPTTAFSNDEDDKAAYARFVLKGASRPNHVRFVAIMEQVQKDQTVFPGGLGRMKWITFCKNWDGFSDVFESKPKLTMRRL